MDRLNFSFTHLEGEIIAIITMEIDLTKKIFAVDGANKTGKPVLVHPAVKRAALSKLIAKLPSWLIGMDSLTSSTVCMHAALQYSLTRSQFVSNSQRPLVSAPFELL